MVTKAETCGKFVVPKLQAAGRNIAPADLVHHLAVNPPLLTRRQRADRVKWQQAAFSNHYRPEAQEVLRDLLEKYARDGELQLLSVRKHRPNVEKLRPTSHHGKFSEIIGKYGGADQLRTAVNQLQSLLYVT